jgi:hypothetical protein
LSLISRLRNKAGPETLSNDQGLSRHFTDRHVGERNVFDNLIVDLLGMALVVFCLIGLLPSRRPARHIRDF